MALVRWTPEKLRNVVEQNAFLHLKKFNENCLYMQKYDLSRGRKGTISDFFKFICKKLE